VYSLEVAFVEDKSRVEIESGESQLAIVESPGNVVVYNTLESHHKVRELRPGHIFGNEVLFLGDVEV